MGVHVAEADLASHELQDLADIIGEGAEAAAGHPLKIHVWIEDGGQPPADVLAAVSEHLTDATGNLKMS